MPASAFNCTSATFASLWLSLSGSLSLWLSLALSGSRWLFLVLSESLWLSLARNTDGAMVQLLVVWFDTRSICSHSTRSVVGGSRTSKVSMMLSGTTFAWKHRSNQGDPKKIRKWRIWFLSASPRGVIWLPPWRIVRLQEYLWECTSSNWLFGGGKFGHLISSLKHCQVARGNISKLKIRWRFKQKPLFLPWQSVWPKIIRFVLHHL